MVTIAIIGVGYFGKHYIRVLREMGNSVKLSAICDISSAVLATHRSSHLSDVIFTTDFKHIVADNSIDAVIVATPPRTHYDIVIACLRSGKHVLVEKPLAVSSEEIERIGELALQMRLICMPGHTFVYNDYIQYLRKIVSERTYGEFRYAYLEWLSFGPLRTDVSCVMDLGVHGLSILDYVFDSGEIVHMSQMRTRIMAAGVDDFAVINMRFKNGFSATLALSWYAPVKVRRVTALGSSMALFDDILPEKKLSFFIPEERSNEGYTIDDFMRYASKRRIVVPDIFVKEPLRNELEHFCACIYLGCEPRAGIKEGLRVVQWLEKIEKNL